MTKIRFTAPTEAFPFFHNVRVLRGNAWVKVISYNDRIGGKEDALFPTQDEMVRKVRALLKGAGA
jgi:hypothetical protein